MESVDALRLIVDARRQPVVEHADAAANRCLPPRKRSPRDTETRPDVRIVVDVRLELVSNARRDGEVLAEANVVLDVEAGLQAAIRNGRIADPARVVARLIRTIRVEIVERVLAQVI